MPFDFNSLEVPDTTEETLEKLLIPQYNEYVDAKPNGSTSFALHYDPTEYLKEKGYFIADTYYMLTPWRYLGIQNINDPLDFHNGVFLLLVGPEHDLKKISLGHSKQKRDSQPSIDYSAIDKAPVAIFQHCRAPLSFCGGELTEERYKELFTGSTISDLFVFRGLYKATKTDSDEYSLEKIWDRYYFMS